MITPIVFLDTETTGLQPHHEIWEVGAIFRADVDADPADDHEYVWQLPVNTKFADPEALELNGYWERRLSLANLTPKVQFARAFSALTVDAILVVNNVVFDVPRIEKIVRDAKCEPMWHHHPRDVQDIAVGYLKGILAEAGGAVGMGLIDPGPPPWSGSQINKMFGIENTGEHTALGDARTVRDLWDVVAK